MDLKHNSLFKIQFDKLHKLFLVGTVTGLICNKLLKLLPVMCYSNIKTNLPKTIKTILDHSVHLVINERNF
jgi:hypothetical protein